MYKNVEKINMWCLFCNEIDMKKFGVLLFCLVLLSWMIVWCSSKDVSDDKWDFIIEEIDTDQIMAYNDSIRDFWLKCFEADESMRDIYNWYNWWSTDEVKSAIDDTVSECKNSMFQINDLWDIDWDSSLKDWVILLIQKMLERYEKLYETLPFLPLLDEWLVEEDSMAYEEIKSELDSLGSEIRDLNKNLSDIQLSFAEAHWYELEQ